MQLAPQELAIAGWSRGILAYKVRKHQRSLYRFVAALDGHDHIIRTGVCARQFGKSFISLLHATEKSRAVEMHRSLVVAPYACQVKDYLIPNMEILIRDCPKPLRPTLRDGHIYHFPETGSTIKLGGADSGNAENLRGPGYHLMIVDEAGVIHDLADLVNSVLLPMTNETKGRIVVIGTPPETPTHYFKQLRDRAEAQGSLLTLTVDDNMSMSAEDRRVRAEAVGGEQSTDFRREYLCEFCVDERRAVLPEYDDEAAKEIAQAVEAPDGHVRRFVAMDPGRVDFCGLLFGYYDFRAATLCVQDELLIKHMKTTDIVEGLMSYETRLWAGLPAGTLTRVSDQNDVLFDLQRLHRLWFQPAKKVQKHAMVNGLRERIRTRRLRVDPRCKGLLLQMRSALWDPQRKEFERPRDMPGGDELGLGHYDLLDALIYMNLSVPENMNPYPKLAPVTDVVRQWVDPVTQGLLGGDGDTAMQELQQRFNQDY